MSLARMIRAANRAIDREWAQEFSTDWDCMEQMPEVKDETLKHELADLELEHRKLCIEEDIRTLKHELEWRVEKRKWDAAQAAEKAKGDAVQAATSVTPLNGKEPPSVH
jgi:hypothetical protein